MGPPHTRTIFGVPGAPRCPSMVARASGAITWARSRGWGPEPLTRQLETQWQRARARATAVSPLGPWARIPAWGQDIRRLTSADTGPDGVVPRHTLRLCGPATYRALLLDRFAARFQQWLLHRSSTRLWFPTHGQEWNILQ